MKELLKFIKNLFVYCVVLYTMIAVIVVLGAAVYGGLLGIATLSINPLYETAISMKNNIETTHLIVFAISATISVAISIQDIKC